MKVRHIFYIFYGDYIFSFISVTSSIINLFPLSFPCVAFATTESQVIHDGLTIQVKLNRHDVVHYLTSSYSVVCFAVLTKEVVSTSYYITYRLPLLALIELILLYFNIAILTLAFVIVFVSFTIISTISPSLSACLICSFFISVLSTIV